MIREYAFDPSVVVTDPNTLQRFLSEFGASQGRVIGEAPRKWKDLVQRKIQAMGLTPRARRNALDQLNRLDNTSVVGRDPRNLGDDGWLERALSLHREAPFNAVLTDADDLGNDQYNYLNMLESGPRDWVIEQTASVVRNAQALADSIDLSLKLSKTNFFVDPYFDPLKEDYRIPFVEYVRRCVSGRVNTNKVFIHTCEIHNEDIQRRKNRADLKRGMNECVAPLLPNGFTAELWIWPFNQLHDRFILTNMVGYAFGHGLNESQYQQAIEVNVNRLGETARAEEFRKFSRAASRIGEPIVVNA